MRLIEEKPRIVLSLQYLQLRIVDAEDLLDFHVAGYHITPVSLTSDITITSDMKGERGTHVQYC